MMTLQEERLSGRLIKLTWLVRVCIGACVGFWSLALVLLIAGRVGATSASGSDVIQNSPSQPALASSIGAFGLSPTATPPATADLAVTKADSPDPATVGDPLTYTITVTNAGPSDATGVVLTDTLPADMTLGSVTSSQGNCSGTSLVTCDIGPMADGAGVTVTVVVTPTLAYVPTNSASVAASETDPDSSDNTAVESTVVLPSPAPTLYGASYSAGGLSTLYSIDPLTGAATEIGSIGFERVSGMDVDGSGTLYATGERPEDNTHVLMTIDPATGAGTEIGPTGIGSPPSASAGTGIESATGTSPSDFDTVTDISFRHSDNTLYAYLKGYGGEIQSVGTLDIQTGAVTVLGSSGTYGSGNGIAFSPPGDTLFHADDSSLNTLDQASGAATFVTYLEFSSSSDEYPQINAMDFEPGSGILFASRNDGWEGAGPNYLATIDTQTGDVTTIGQTVDGLDAIAFAPARADISITKEPDQTVTSGSDVTFTITVTNTGEVDLTNVRVTDTMAPDCERTFQSLAVEASRSYTCTRTNVTSGFTNSASATGTSPAGEDVTDTDTAAVTVIQPGADLAVTKSDSPDPVWVGRKLTYTIRVTNNGPATATGVTVNDTVPRSMVFDTATSTQGSCSKTGDTVICNLGSLAHGAGATVTVVVTPMGEGTVSNRASVAGQQSDPNSDNNSDIQFTGVNPAADLLVTKTGTPDPVTVENPLTYTLTLTNAGPSDATGVTVTDILPAGVIFGAAAPSQGNCSGTSSITCDLGALANGAGATVTVVVTPTVAGTITNTASVTANELDPDTGNNNAATETTVNPAADLSVTKADSPDPVIAGGTLTYTLTLTNTGPSDATGVVLTDTLPPGVISGAAAPSQGTCGETSPVTCDLGSLAHSTSATVTVVVTPAVAGTITNTASVTANELDPDTSNNSAATETTVNPAADLSITKADSPDPVIAGGTLTYTLTITNTGPSDATGVTVTDTLPSGVIFGAAAPSQGICSGTSPVTCSIGTVAHSASVTVTLVVTPATRGIITNTARVTANEIDPIPGNNVAAAGTMVHVAPIVVNSTGDGGDADTGDGVCDVNPSPVRRQCTLRAAIQQANANPGREAIAFNIPSASVPAIRPGSALPPVTDPVVIDATTQPSGKVELDGSQAGAGANGLRITAGDSRVSGLVVTRFSGHGIVLETHGGNVIRNNDIGPAALSAVAGSPARNPRSAIAARPEAASTLQGPTPHSEVGNGGDGVHIRGGSQHNQIGPGNVIAHNRGDGVRVAGATTTGNTITRNSIHSNAGQGIANIEGGNMELAPPALAGAVGNKVTGTAPPTSTVEIFGDAADEGRFFLGSTTADGQGNFQFAGSLRGVNVTATATDEAGNTSEFASPVPRETAIPDTYEDNDEIPLAYPVAAGETYTSYISSATDVDFYKLPVPQRGSTVAFTLTDLTADFDLILYVPTDVPSDTPLSDIPLSDIPLSDIPLSDIPLSDIPLSDIPLSDIPLSDIPLSDIPLSDIPLSDISFHRGTGDEQVSDVVLHATDFYYVQVIGHNGAYSAEPYILEVEVQPPPPSPTCTRTITGTGTTGTVYQPFDAGDTQTLILVNRQRVEQLYGTGAANNLIARLQDFADHATVKGMILPVETDPAVAAAYDNWDQDTCDPEAANEVAGAIKNLISSYFEDPAYANLTYLVIAGSDEVIPFRRILDIVYTSNEYEYRNSAHVQPDSAHYASLNAGYMWTDDFYVDFEPTNYGGRPLYVVNYPVGRLVETPGEIVTQLDHYLARGGVITATTSLATGYDFLTDSSLIISDTLGNAKGLGNDALISETWSAQDLIDNYLDVRHDINSINAHFDHYRAEPGDRMAGLFSSDDIDQPDVDLAGTVNFSMGCHAGLNVCDLVSTGGPANPVSQDFAQVLSRKQAVFVGNTGFGYGDTIAPTLSEELMINFASNLGAAATPTVGEALQKAKQDYALNSMGNYGPYDEKVLIEATLYGPPMYRVSVPSANLATRSTQPATRNTQPAIRNTQPECRTQNGLPVCEYAVTPTFTRVNTPDGTYFTAEGGTQAMLYRPIQPRVTLDIALPDGEGDGALAHGALFLGGRYDTEIPNFDPAITMPVTETTRYEPQWIYTGWRPQELARINHYQTPQGVLERLVLTMGQFLHTEVVEDRVIGVERLYDEVTYDIYYSVSDDITPPTIKSSTGRQVGNGVRLAVKVSDASGVERVIVTYTDAEAATWRSLDLTYDASADQWVGELTPGAGGFKFFTQAVDGAGNVGGNRAKGVFFTPVTVEAGDDRTVNEGDEVAFSGSGPDTEATILWDFGDGLGAAGTYEPTHRYRDDGVFEVSLRVGDEAGSTGSDSLSVTVNNVAPAVSIEEVISRIPGYIFAGDVVTTTASFGDPGPLDTHSATIAWGDGAVEAGTVNQRADTVSGTHTYAEGGTFDIEVCVTDDDGGKDCETVQVTVQAACTLVDLTGEFVTGEVGGTTEVVTTAGTTEVVTTDMGAGTTEVVTTSVDLVARVSNVGETPAQPGVQVAFYRGDPEAGGTLIGTAATAQTLDIGASEAVTVTWDVAVAGDYDIYIVVDDDDQLTECSEANSVQQTVSILDVPLVESWNLVSTYVEPFNTDINVVQRPIEGQYMIIRGRDGSYYPDLPAEVNTLKSIDAEHGYWVKMLNAERETRNSAFSIQQSAFSLRVVGAKFAEDRPVELDAGWNLVSYLPRQPLSVSEALQSIEGQYTAVLGFDQGALSYYPDLEPAVNTLHTMQPGFGYWIRMTTTGTLQYPATGDQRSEIRGTESPIPNLQSLISNLRKAERAAGVTPTDTWVNVYGAARWPDGAPLPAGTTVQALDPDGVVCGAAVVTSAGHYGLLACYGDDPTTAGDEGARPGDTIRLVVDGQTLGTWTWTAHGDRHQVPLGPGARWRIWLPLVTFKR